MKQLSDFLLSRVSCQALPGHVALKEAWLMGELHVCFPHLEELALHNVRPFLTLYPKIPQ
jgi:hypothetical protein